MHLGEICQKNSAHGRQPKRLFDQWNGDGTLDKILQSLQGEIGIDTELWCIDGTVIRAARCASGGGKKRGPGRTRGSCIRARERISSQFFGPRFGSDVVDGIERNRSNSNALSRISRLSSGRRRAEAGRRKWEVIISRVLRPISIARVAQVHRQPRRTPSNEELQRRAARVFGKVWCRI